MDFFDALLIPGKPSNFIFNSLIHACSFMPWFEVVVSQTCSPFWSYICRNLNLKYNLFVYFFCLLFNACTSKRFRSWIHVHRRTAKFRFMLGTSEQGEVFFVPLLLSQEASVFLFHLKECPNLVALHVMHRILRTYWNVHPDGTLNFYFFNIC